MLRWQPIEESFGSRQSEQAEASEVSGMRLSSAFQAFLILSGGVGTFLLISGLAEKPTAFRIFLMACLLAPLCLTLLSRAPLRWSGHGPHLRDRHR